MSANALRDRTTEMEVTIRPIGVVESPFRTVGDRCDYAAESFVRLRPELAAGLNGIEYFSHIWVIYHQHCANVWLGTRGLGAPLPLILPADDDRAGQGIFSSRAPCRPSLLGSCIVELVRREGAALVVRGLDAIDRTPVLDVKPYVPQFDAFPDAVVPLHWAKVMDRPGDRARLSRELHWDTSNVDFALGLRAGVAALRRLGAKRGDPLLAEGRGSMFFAHGFEMATGCSLLRATLAWTESRAGAGPWSLRIANAGNRACALELTRICWADAASVLAADETDLLTASDA
jgi:tRNA-Thr(GGU) m(6)t(6)A37 methyltransferase TsaA